MDYRRELLKGNIQTLVLAVLSDAPRHGYGIAQEILRRSGDALRFGEGSIYPALHALEREGSISGEWETPQGGPARKVYRLTDQGTQELAMRKQTWSDFARTIDRVIGGSPDAQPI
jgi:PadR family transcriptional regulator PadR